MTKLILRLERLHAPTPAADSDVPFDGPFEPSFGAEAPAPELHVVDLGDHVRPATSTTPLARWVATAAASHDACLVLDKDGRVLSLSTSAADVLGCSDAAAVGRRLLDIIELVDFDTGGVRPDYATRIAPLAVLAPGHGLMRSLLRVRRTDGSRSTVDASAAPIHDARGATVGSFTFLAPVRS